MKPRYTGWSADCQNMPYSGSASSAVNDGQSSQYESKYECYNNSSTDVDGRKQSGGGRSDKSGRSDKTGRSNKSGRSDKSKKGENQGTPIDKKTENRNKVLEPDKTRLYVKKSCYMCSDSDTEDRCITIRSSKSKTNLSVRSFINEYQSSQGVIETRFGYCGLHPEWLQRFNTPGFLVYCTSIFSFIMGFIANGVQSVIYTSLERRFNMNSQHIGYIIACYNISAPICALLLGKYAIRNKARYFAMVVICSAVGSIVFALPHFTTGLYKGGLQSASTCVSSVCGEDTALTNYLGVFILGQLLHGIGGTALFTVAASLIDDSVRPNTMPLVLGCIYASNIVGLGLGFFLGAQALKVYVDFDQVKDAEITLTINDPSWVGAWWPFHLCAGVIQLLITIPLFGFGSELPAAEEIRMHRRNNAHRPSMILTDKLKYSLGKKHKSLELSLIQTYGILFRNPCFIFVVIAIGVEGAFLTGCAAFLSKYIETVYRVTSTESGTFAGGSIVPAATIGLVSGGLIAKKYNFTILQNLKFIFAMNACAVIGVHCIFIQCEPVKIIGVALEYTGKAILDVNDKHLSHQCNQHCKHCTTGNYEPVCSKESGIYFSPCFAGCTNKTDHLDKSKSYSNCNCMKELPNDNQTQVVMQQGNYTLTNKGCFDTCDNVYFFVAFMFVSMTFSMLPVAPLDTVTFRCVTEEQKSHALGLKTLIVRLFGLFCGPFVVGSLINKTCVVYKEDCGSKTSCWIYDSWYLLLALYGFIMTCKTFTLFCVFMAHQTYKPPVAKYASTKNNDSFHDTLNN